MKAQMLPRKPRDLAGGEGRELIDEEVESDEIRNGFSRAMLSVVHVFV